MTTPEKRRPPRALYTSVLFVLILAAALFALSESNRSELSSKVIASGQVPFANSSPQASDSDLDEESIAATTTSLKESFESGSTTTTQKLFEENVATTSSTASETSTTRSSTSSSAITTTTTLPIANPTTTTTISSTSTTTLQTTTSTAPQYQSPRPTPPPYQAIAGEPSAARFTELRVCVSNDDYASISPGGQRFGAYRITEWLWDLTVTDLGWTDLIGVKPNIADPWEQDRVALEIWRDSQWTKWPTWCS